MVWYIHHKQLSWGTAQFIRVLADQNLCTGFNWKSENVSNFMQLKLNIRKIILNKSLCYNSHASTVSFPLSCEQQIHKAFQISNNFGSPEL